MRRQEELFEALSRSRFRSRFKLNEKERAYLRDMGIKVVKEHARDFVEKRLAIAKPVNDGRQTPMKGHPVFVAQHATATCCRKCLAKWHHISQARPLDKKEIEHIISVILEWLKKQKAALSERCNQYKLFEKQESGRYNQQK